ncbi:MAG: hypothetical protein R3A45_03140 [Bdellovibrionota bacterium]
MVSDAQETEMDVEEVELDTTKENAISNVEDNIDQTEQEPAQTAPAATKVVPDQAKPSVAQKESDYFVSNQKKNPWASKHVYDQRKNEIGTSYIFVGPLWNRLSNLDDLSQQPVINSPKLHCMLALAGRLLSRNPGYLCHPCRFCHV